MCVVTYFFVLSHSLGPMLQMIANMFEDISTFLQIMMAIYLGFVCCTLFVLKNSSEMFDGPLIAVMICVVMLLLYLNVQCQGCVAHCRCFHYFKQPLESLIGVCISLL